MANTHAGCSREHRTRSGIRIDGHWSSPDGVENAFQFYCCYWYGCLRGFPDNREENNTESMKSSCAQTLVRTTRLRKQGVHRQKCGSAISRIKQKTIRIKAPSFRTAMYARKSLSSHETRFSEVEQEILFLTITYRKVRK